MKRYVTAVDLRDLRHMLSAEPVAKLAAISPADIEAVLARAQVDVDAFVDAEPQRGTAVAAPHLIDPGILR